MRLAILLASAAVTAGTLGGCEADDQSRPGFPRTSRTPLEGAPFPYVEGAEDVGISSDAIWLFKERLYSRVVARHVVGAEVLVLVDGRVVLHQAMGWADRNDLVPMERNSIFRLASMTKPLVGTATLMLADEGRIGLDEPVSRYLDSFRAGTSRNVTVRHLLTHRSGSDALGAVVATVSGKPVEAYIEERILGPLEMTDTHTFFSPAAEWARRVPSSYRSWGGSSWERWWNPSRPHDTEWFSPAGDLFGSAFDYARFLQVWVDRGELQETGERILQEPTVEEALADPVAADTLPVRDRWYGMQWEIYAPPSEAGGLPAFGHRGATGTLGMAIPARKAIVIYLTNSNETEVVEEVIDAALQMFGN